ncbi:MAG: sialate O-acetylesterase [Cyanobacteria bacterium P01_A01_bin.105]
MNTSILAATLGGFLIGTAAGAASFSRLRSAEPEPAQTEPQPLETPEIAFDLGTTRPQLFVLMGQSNIAGTAPVPAAPATHPQVLLFGNDYRWQPAVEPLDTALNQVDAVSADPGAGLGPGMAFALALMAQDETRTIGLIPCATWGATLHQWQRDLSDQSLYGSCLKRIQAAATVGDVTGVIFFQGEADALDPVIYPNLGINADSWGTRFTDWVSQLRHDLGSPHLPLVYAQIGSHQNPEKFPQWATIQQQQARLTLPHSAMIRTDDLPLADEVHFTASSYRIIGQRFAEAFLSVSATDSPPEVSINSPPNSPTEASINLPTKASTEARIN